MRIKAPRIKVALAMLVVFQSTVPSTTNADEILGRLKRLFTETEYKGTEPAMGQDCAMECLAQNIDWLEHHIDTYGSVVAKQPDIWGEARLTKHRDEYERMMFRELGEFNNTINASISQSDGAFLAQAFALSAAATGEPGNTTIDKAGDDPVSVNVGNVVATLPSSPGITANDWTSFGFAKDRTDEKDFRIKLDPVTHLDQKSRYLKHLHELRRINEGDDTSDSPGYSMNLVRIPVSILPGKLTRQGFGAEITVTAEPVISDDLMPTTFRNLAINDVVDFLGLPLVRVTESLTIVEEAINSPRLATEYRDAIGFIEGKFSETEMNSETFVAAVRPSVNTILENGPAVQNLIKTLKEIANRAESTPTSPLPALRSLTQMESKVRSRVDTISISAMNKLSQSEDQKKILDKLIKEIESQNAVEIAKQIFALRQLNKDIVIEISEAVSDLVRENENVVTANARSVFASSIPSGRTRRAFNPLSPSTLEPVIGIENIAVISRVFNQTYYGKHIRWNGGRQGEVDCNENRVALLDSRRYLEAEVQAAYELLSEQDHLCLFAELANPSSGLASQIRSGHFTRESGCAVQMYRHYFFSKLHESHANCCELNTNGSVVPCTFEELLTGIKAIEPGLAEAPNGSVANNSEGPLCKELEDYRGCVPSRAVAPPCPEAETPVEALAWAIVVESALLNERLNRDVQKLAKAKDAYALNTSDDHWFFLPDTVTASAYVVRDETSAQEIEKSQLWQTAQMQFQSANEVFKEYVRVRWPIHVFAVDPVNQDQNVADASARKRELQFALALGFTSGQIGSNSLTQFSRELQTEVETISLNRTIVGFSHGTDTFGWRFYPRVQGLNAPGTLGAIRETIMGTSRDYDLRHRQIEPGQRECVAVVLMPSFVPYADFDIRTDWFKLTNPKNTALTMKDSLKLSRAVTAMRNSRATCAECQHLYREGELHRLFKRVDQLDRELPLQSQRSMVPYENTLGGFEMFNTGVTDLSPELIGWYGAPGVNTTANPCGCYQGCSQIVKAGCDTVENCNLLAASLKGLNTAIADSPLPACQGPGTTLFLVGDNFSVHDTRVIAGGICIPQVRLISRELMQVTIPHCINTVELCENGKTNTYVTIHIATPYGVTNHLHVPVMKQNACGGDCSSVVNRTSASVNQSTASVLLGNENAGAVQQISFNPEPRTLSSNGLGTPVRLVAQFESNAEAEALASGIMKLSDQLKKLEADVQALTTSTNLSQIDVRVSYPDAPAPQNDHSWCDAKDFPILNRIKTNAGEQWRNCRDSLPGN